MIVNWIYGKKNFHDIDFFEGILLVVKPHHAEVRAERAAEDDNPTEWTLKRAANQLLLQQKSSLRKRSRRKRKPF